MMEMFIKMREDDTKEIRELNRKKEERRERQGREASPVFTTAEKQPACSTTDSSDFTDKTTLMTKSDEVEVFVKQLEIALKFGGFPRCKWKRQSQKTNRSVIRL